MEEEKEMEVYSKVVNDMCSPKEALKAVYDCCLSSECSHPKQEEVKETLYDYEKKNNLCGEPVESSNLMVNKLCGNKKPCSRHTPEKSWEGLEEKR